MVFNSITLVRSLHFELLHLLNNVKALFQQALQSSEYQFVRTQFYGHSHKWRLFGESGECEQSYPNTTLSKRNIADLGSSGAQPIRIIATNAPERRPLTGFVSAAAMGVPAISDKNRDAFESLSYPLRSNCIRNDAFAAQLQNQPSLPTQPAESSQRCPVLQAQRPVVLSSLPQRRPRVLPTSAQRAPAPVRRRVHSAACRPWLALLQPGRRGPYVPLRLRFPTPQPAPPPRPAMAERAPPPPDNPRPCVGGGSNDAGPSLGSPTSHTVVAPGGRAGAAAR